MVDPRPTGQIIGVYGGRPFSESVADYFGRHFTYTGVAPRRTNGQYDPAALREGEFIVEPGLLYCIVPAGTKSGMGRLLDTLGHSAARRVSARQPANEHRSDSGPVAMPDDDGGETGNPPAVSPDQKRRALQEVLASIAAFASFALLAHLLLTVLQVG
ncbi:MAG TPA: hypothetical protein VN795_00280 [Stellaceae bacterium]|nr:hypothetical protein [Stellaceae bacterium]